MTILTDEEVQDFVAINFSEYFKSTKEKLYSKLNEEWNLRKVAKSLYTFLTTPDEVKKYTKMIQSNFSDNCVNCYNIEVLNLFDPEFQWLKTIIKNKLKNLLSELKKFKVQTILVLDYKKRNNHKIFHSKGKLIASNSDINQAFKSMNQSIMTKIKNYACED